MKYFLFADEIGNYVYYDHSEGRMLCLPLATQQSVMQENFGQEFASMNCGTTHFYFQMYDKLSAMVVSNQGEPEVCFHPQTMLVSLSSGEQRVWTDKWTSCCQ